MAPPLRAEHLSPYAIRRIVLEQSMRAGVGHIGSSLSVADILTALYSKVLRASGPDDPDRDRFVLSKGHAALALYAALHLKGWLSKEQLSTFCTDGSLLGVHPERALTGVDFATGSLGQGITMGVGAALAARLAGSHRRTFVLASDAECNEGSLWEAAMFASHHRLAGLVVIIDLNGQQALGYTKDVLDLSPLEDRWRAFGWDAPAVPIMHDRLTAVFKKIGVDYEIIFVNDKSPDNAAEVLAALAARDPKVVVINHSRSFGSQGAFTSGMRVATGDAVVLLDGDLQDPPELIEDFHRKWLEGYDVVYGVRTRRVATSFLKAAYKIFYRIFRATSYIPMPLDAGDFSLISRRAVDTLNALPENNRFLRGLRTWVGFRQTGVSYVRPERMFGCTTNSLMKNLAWARKGIVSFSYIPLDFITLIALATVCLSLLAGIVQVAMHIFYPGSAPRGITTIILIILFMGGIQLLCLGIIGSYLAHIYDEVKRRPAFIVESILNRPAPGDEGGRAQSQERA